MTDQKVAKCFNAHAAHYDTPWTTFIGEHELRKIRPLIPPNSTVLDYGCGTGRVTLDLLRRGCTVTAYDISRQMQMKAQAKTEQAGFIGDKIEFINNCDMLNGRSWSYISCIGVMDYYPDPVPMLDYLKNLLKPDGHLIVTFPNAYSPLGWLYALGSRATVPATIFTPVKANQAVKSAGYQVSSLHYAFPSIPLVGLTIIMGLV